jgi:hypothetical protein
MGSCVSNCYCQYGMYTGYCMGGTYACGTNVNCYTCCDVGTFIGTGGYVGKGKTTYGDCTSGSSACFACQQGVRTSWLCETGSNFDGQCV